MAQQEDKHSFRNEKNRAHSKVKKNKKREVPVSHYIEKAKPGDVLWGYQFSQSGLIKDLTIAINFLNGESMPLNIEIQKTEGRGQLEIDTLALEGENDFHNHSIEKGDRILFKARNLEDHNFTARNIFISFNLEI